MKLNNMYRLLLLFLGNKRLTRDYIAEKLEVSQRSVQRYVEALGDAGVPITVIRGMKGGYCLANDYTVPKTLFSAEEMERLTASVMAMSLSYNDRISESVMMKLNSISSSNAYVSPSMIIDASGWNNTQALIGKLDAILAAIDQRVTLQLTYRDKFGNSLERRVDPYNLAQKEGFWYMYGFCHLRGEFRIFRLARMRELILTDDVFEKRSDSDVRAALDAPLGEKDIMLRLRFDESALDKVDEWLGEDSIKETESGYTATALVAGGDYLIRRILSLGQDVVVQSPQSVRKAVMDAAAALLGNY